jgi:mRNA-degrading endonuclease toxin of MazEF toxin-antitoxin module
MADQITTVSKLRLANKERNLSLSDMKKIEQAIKTQLDF